MHGEVLAEDQKLAPIIGSGLPSPSRLVAELLEGLDRPDEVLRSGATRIRLRCHPLHCRGFEQALRGGLPSFGSRISVLAVWPPGVGDRNLEERELK